MKRVLFFTAIPAWYGSTKVELIGYCEAFMTDEEFEKMRKVKRKDGKIEFTLGRNETLDDKIEEAVDYCTLHNTSGEIYDCKTRGSIFKAAVSGKIVKRKENRK